MQGCQLVESHKSAGSGPVRSPEAVPARTGGSNPCWSTRKSQVRPAERQRAPTSKKCGEMNPLDLFCIGGNEFVFHLDGELNSDGCHRLCRFRALHILLKMTKLCNDIFFVFFKYCDCTENTVRI